jgi:hypothetical protein
MKEIRIILDTETRKRLQLTRQVPRFMDFILAKIVRNETFSNFKIRGKKIVIIWILDTNLYFQTAYPYFATKLI